MEDFHCHVALVELDVVGELVEELVDLDEELDVAHAVGSSALGFLLEALPLVLELVGLSWLRLDLNLEGHVAPQVLELHEVVVRGIVPRRLVHLDVVALVPLVLVAIGVAVLVLA